MNNWEKRYSSLVAEHQILENANKLLRQEVNLLRNEVKIASMNKENNNKIIQQQFDHFNKTIQDQGELINALRGKLKEYGSVD